MNLIPLVFFCPRISMTSSFKNTKVELELLADTDTLSMVEIAIRGGLCHSIYRHARANIKQMKNYDKSKESA